MGKLGKLFKKGGKEHRIVMLGLDNAGKTTYVQFPTVLLITVVNYNYRILYKQKLGEVVQTTPTIGQEKFSISLEK